MCAGFVFLFPLNERTYPLVKSYYEHVNEIKGFTINEVYIDLMELFSLQVSANLSIFLQAGVKLTFNSSISHMFYLFHPGTQKSWR